MSTQPILAYDCAISGASIALMQGGRTQMRTIANTRQAAELIPTIDALLGEHRVAYADLGAIVTTLGPGSFTGVRIGLAALHGFAMVHATPIKLLTTLEAIAWKVARLPDAPREWIVSLRAGKGELYTQAFRREGAMPQHAGEIALCPETQTAWPLPCYGHAQNAALPLMETPDAALMCEVAAVLPTATLSEALPLYIRPPDAAIPQAYAWL